MTYSKTAIQKAVQAFQILHGVALTPWHCEKLMGLLAQAQEAEAAPPPAYGPDAVAKQPEYDECCGSPATCEQPCFHRPAAPVGDGWGVWLEWLGGECPVPARTYVQAEHRSGDIFEGEALWAAGLGASNWIRGKLERSNPHHLDIVRYRVKA